MKDKAQPAAILLNTGDWGFGHFVIDDESLKVFEEKMSKIENALDRNVVMGQLISMMRMGEYAATRFHKIRSQYTDEKNQNLITALHQACSLAAKSYLPPDEVPKFEKETGEFFLKKAKKASDNKDLQNFCLEKAIEFMNDKDGLTAAADWILKESISVEDTKLGCTLTPAQKYTIVKKYWACTEFSKEQKDELRKKCFDKDDSEPGMTAQKVLDYSLPDKDLKERLWKEITDKDSKESLLELRCKMEGLWQPRQQLDLMKPFFDKYYDTVKKVVDERDREFAQAFMNALSPACMAREEDKKKFEELYGNTSDSTHFFTLFLQKEKTLIEIAEKARKVCTDLKEKEKKDEEKKEEEKKEEEKKE